VGASLRRTRVGDVYVAERARADGCVFGGEPSGAWIWPEETLCPDGTLAACRLVEAVARRGPLSSLADAIDSYPIRRGSIDVADDAKAAVMEGVQRQIESEYGDPTTLDGVRVDSDGGWFLIRASGTQPLVRVTAEARDDSQATELFERARSFVEMAR
jgi:Phosphomannomutase